EDHGLDGLPLGEEPVDDAPLVEDLQGAGVEAPGPRPDQLGRRAALQDHHVHARERQLSRQHESSRASARDDNVVHLASPSAVPARRRALTSGRVWGTTGALPQAPGAAIPWKWRGRRRLAWW